MIRIFTILLMCFICNANAFASTNRAPIIVHSDKLVVFENENKAIFTGNVISKQADTTLKSEEMIVFYKDGMSASDKDSVKRIEIYNSVELITPKERVTSDRGYYEEGLLHLIGNVKMHDHNNVIHGEKFVYNSNTKKSSLIGSRNQNGASKKPKLIIQPSGSDNAT